MEIKLKFIHGLVLWWWINSKDEKQRQRGNHHRPVVCSCVIAVKRSVQWLPFDLKTLVQAEGACEVNWSVNPIVSKSIIPTSSPSNGDGSWIESEREKLIEIFNLEVVFVVIIRSCGAPDKEDVSG